MYFFDDKNIMYSKIIFIHDQIAPLSSLLYFMIFQQVLTYLKSKKKKMLNFDTKKAHFKILNLQVLDLSLSFWTYDWPGSLNF